MIKLLKLPFSPSSEPPLRIVRFASHRVQNHDREKFLVGNVSLPMSAITPISVAIADVV